MTDFLLQAGETHNSAMRDFEYEGQPRMFCVVTHNGWNAGA